MSLLFCPFCFKTASRGDARFSTIRQCELTIPYWLANCFLSRWRSSCSSTFFYSFSAVHLPISLNSSLLNLNEDWHLYPFCANDSATKWAKKLESHFEDNQIVCECTEIDSPNWSDSFIAKNSLFPNIIVRIGIFCNPKSLFLSHSQTFDSLFFVFQRH